MLRAFLPGFGEKIGRNLSEINSIYFPKRNQAQEGCSKRPIGHLMSAAPNRIETCTGKFVAKAYKDEQTNTSKHTHQFTNMMGKSCRSCAL